VVGVLKKIPTRPHKAMSLQNPMSGFHLVMDALLLSVIACILEVTTNDFIVFFQISPSPKTSSPTRKVNAKARQV